jgi:hypothetical protein
MAVNNLNAIVTQRIEVSPGLLILRVAPDGWELPEFSAGQFAVLGLRASSARSVFTGDEAMGEGRPYRFSQT